MKLEIGMYVRLDGIFTKVKHQMRQIPYILITELENGKCLNENEYKHYNINASHNIIDLIEVGDYVNGYRVNFINETYTINGKETPIIYTDEQKYYAGGWNKKRFESLISDDKIVTKEQFESVEYNV